MSIPVLLVLCQPDGTIAQVLQDSAAWTAAKPVSIYDLLDPESVLKAQDFMATVSREGFALNWELRFLSGTRNETWEFCGFHTECGIHLAAKPLSDTTLLQTALSEINSDLVNSQRQLAQQTIRLQQMNRANMSHTTFLENLYTATQAVVGELESEAILQRIAEHIVRLLPNVTAVSILTEHSTAERSQPTAGMTLPLKMSAKQHGQLHLSGVFSEEDQRRAEIFITAANTALSNAALVSHIHEESITDPLTGAYNRRGWSDLGQREVARVHRSGHPMSVVMLDIDHFKSINDTWGHTLGDEVLISLVSRVEANLRDIDILGRYGGEEFIVLLPETDHRAAVQVAERLRSTIAATPIIAQPQQLSITISLGIVTLSPEEPTTFEQLTEMADTALYQAKRTGRNRLVSAPTSFG
jgi:diguanylate cyclase (GGDEF)-like protein